MVDERRCLVPGNRTIRGGGGERTEWMKKEEKKKRRGRKKAVDEGPQIIT